MTKLLGMLCSGGLIAACAGVHAATFSIHPAQPRYLEPVFVRITPELSSSGYGEHIQGAQVVMTGAALEVRYQAGRDLGVGRPFDVMLGRFPTGRYAVQARVHSFTLFEPVAVGEFSVGEGPPPNFVTPGVASPAVNYGGLWWNPAEPGWGLNIEQGPTNLIFMTWFVYDASGRPAWYTLQPGQWDGPARYAGPIYRTTGPALGTAFDPGALGVTAVGTGALEFSAFDRATFRYTADGVTGVREITRQPVE